MTVSEKASYIKGLMEGMNFDTKTNEGKLFAAIVDLLEDLSLSVTDLEDETSAMRDYVDEMDNDLASVEGDLYGDEDYFDDEELPDDEDGEEAESEHDCVNCDEEDCVVSLECPACGETIYSEVCELEKRDTMVCPSCGQVLNVVREEEDEDEESEEDEGDDE